MNENIKILIAEDERKAARFFRKAFQEDHHAVSESHIRILMIDDEIDLLQTWITILESEGYAVDSVSDGIQGMNAVRTHHYDLILLDIVMPKVDGIEVLEFVKEKYPSIEVIMLTGVSDLKIAVECMNKGAFYYILKPFNVAELLQTIKRALEHRRLLLENSVMRLQLSRIEGYGEIIGESAAFRNVLEMAQRVAASDSSVLLQGASGTGKEVVANFIYKKSLRVDKPFIALNCASIPDSLIESELFGYEKGAFTDAQAQKQGLVELADGGTLFLDEIGDISPVFQPKLLRFIQTGEYRRIGGNTLLRADVRVFSASNKDLREEVRLGRFREDLLYRLNVITIVIPPLKERKEDIPILIENFIKRKLRTRVRKEISPEAMEMIMKYDWPGNIRELENVIEGAILLSKTDRIMPQDLPLPITLRTPPGQLDGAMGMIGTLISMKEIERLHIRSILQSTLWNKTKAAQILGISLKTLYGKLAHYNIKPD